VETQVRFCIQESGMTSPTKPIHQMTRHFWSMRLTESRRGKRIRAAIEKCPQTCPQGMRSEVGPLFLSAGAGGERFQRGNRPNSKGKRTEASRRGSSRRRSGALGSVTSSGRRKALRRAAGLTRHVSRCVLRRGRQPLAGRAARAPRHRAPTHVARRTLTTRSPTSSVRNAVGDVFELTARLRKTTP